MQVFLKFSLFRFLRKILVILIFLTKWALFTIINFGYNPWVPKFWVPNPHGYPRVTPKKTQNFELYGYPTRKYPWISDTNPTQPIPKIWFGFGYYPWVPEFWVPNPHNSTYLKHNTKHACFFRILIRKITRKYCVPYEFSSLNIYQGEMDY